MRTAWRTRWRPTVHAVLLILSVLCSGPEGRRVLPRSRKIDPDRDVKNRSCRLERESRNPESRWPKSVGTHRIGESSKFLAWKVEATPRCSVSGSAFPIAFARFHEVQYRSTRHLHRLSREPNSVVSVCNSLYIISKVIAPRCDLKVCSPYIQIERRYNKEDRQGTSANEFEENRVGDRYSTEQSAQCSVKRSRIRCATPLATCTSIDNRAIDLAGWSTEKSFDSRPDE